MRRPFLRRARVKGGREVRLSWPHALIRTLHARGRMIPSFFIRDRGVLGFRPRRSSCLPLALDLPVTGLEDGQDVSAFDILDRLGRP